MFKTYELPDTAAALEGFKEYLVGTERAPATISKYLTDVKKFFLFLNGKDVVDKTHMIAFKESLPQQYKPASCNSIIAAVNRFMDYMGAGDLKLKLFKHQNRTSRPAERYLSQEEFMRLVNTAKDKGKRRLAYGMEAIAMTGVRISELKFFTVENVKKGRILVRNKGKIRTILLPDQLKMRLLLYAQQEHIRSGSIFITSHGKPIDRSNFWREMQQLKMEAHVNKDKIFPHNLRHLFAHIYYQMTKDLVGLGDLLGHSNINVTRIYTMKTEEMQLDMLNRISCYIDKKTG